MHETLLAELIAYLGEDYNEYLLPQARLCVNRAVASFKAYMNYPADYMVEDEETGIAPYQTDMQNNYYCIFDLVLYFWNQIGMEYQTEHRESGNTMVFNTEATIYATHGVIPFATVM